MSMKNPLSLQLNVDDFLPAGEDEKQSLVVMRESVSFWKDGARRLSKNPIAMVSLVVLIIIFFFSFVVPAFYPYAYEEQIRGSENLAPMTYSQAELAAKEAGEKVFPHVFGTDSLGRCCRACSMLRAAVSDRPRTMRMPMRMASVPRLSLSSVQSQTLDRTSTG